MSNRGIVMATLARDKTMQIKSVVNINYLDSNHG